MTFPVPPHSGTMEYPGGQLAVIEACMNFRTVTAVFGRSSGKTTTLPYLFVEEGQRIVGPYDYAYCAPTQRLARKQWRLWRQMFEPFLDEGRGLQGGASAIDLILHIKPFGRNSGASVEFWGLDEHDNLRGDRKNRIVVDECKDVHPDAIYKTLRGMLLGRSGKWLFIGTPSRLGVGAAWFKAEYYKGQNPADYPNHFSLRFPSFCNPWLTPEELQAIEEDVDDDKAYREEILAEFLDDEGAVFENLSAVFTLKPIRSEGNWLWVAEEPIKATEGTTLHPGDPAATYAIGLDLGRSPTGDPSVASVFNLQTRNQAALMRLRGMTYATQLEYVHRLREDYNRAIIYFDATGGHGVSMTEELAHRYGDGAIGRTWTMQNKEADISRGRLLCHRAGSTDLPGPGWHLIDVPWQRGEFECYTMTTESRSGERLKNPKYSAPPGLHDDSVAASLLVSSALMHDHRAYAPPQKEAPYLTGGWLLDRLKHQRRSEKIRRWTRA